MIVKGENIIVYIYEGSDWLPYACGRSCSFEITTDFVETSVSGTGKNATFLPTKNSFTGSLDGVTNLNMAGMLALPDFHVKQLAHTKLLMRFERTDIVANIFTSECYCYISSSSDTGAKGDVASFSIGLRGTGEIVNIYTPTTPGTGTPYVFGNAVQTYTYTAIGGENNFTAGALVNKTIAAVFKDGILFTSVAASATPAGKEYRFTKSSGLVEFGIPFEPNEKAHILYQ